MASRKKEEIKPVPPKKLRKRKSKSDTYYVSPKEFFEDLKEFYKTDIIPDQLANKINKIVEGLSYAPNFINYSYKAEMVGDARVKMVAALIHKKFDINSGSNPFSYFTTIAFHAFINRIKKEKKHHETIENFQEQSYTELLNSGEGSTKNVYVNPDHQDQYED